MVKLVFQYDIDIKAQLFQLRLFEEPRSKKILQFRANDEVLIKMNKSYLDLCYFFLFMTIMILER